MKPKYALLIISLALIFSMSLWFSTSIVLVELENKWNLNSKFLSILHISIPIGFIIGTLVSALLSLNNRFNNRLIFAFSILGAGLINLLLLFIENGSLGIIVRIITGIFIAGVYPSAINLTIQWFPKNKGLGIGILIAGLTVGTALPYLINVFTVNINLASVIMTTSLLAFFAFFLIYIILKNSPEEEAYSVGFQFSDIVEIISKKRIMLVIFGYIGHMWEMYAMWFWLPFFLKSSFEEYSYASPVFLSSIVAFISIGIGGGLGCIIGGILGDKIGKSETTTYAMIVSAICCLIVGFSYGQHIFLVALTSFVWGASSVADSAQFSAALSEFVDKNILGSSITFKLSLGYLVTLFSINLLPVVQEFVGWKFAFIFLSFGPILGTLSMLIFNNQDSNFYDQN